MSGGNPILYLPPKYQTYCTNPLKCSPPEHQQSCVPPVNNIPEPTIVRWRPRSIRHPIQHTQQRRPYRPQTEHTIHRNRHSTRTQTRSKPQQPCAASTIKQTSCKPGVVSFSISSNASGNTPKSGNLSIAGNLRSPW